eukprot:576258-Amphidinium_carterae.1
MIHSQCKEIIFVCKVMCCKVLFVKSSATFCERYKRRQQPLKEPARVVVEQNQPGTSHGGNSAD